MALVVVGTARKPNKSDLRARGLTGLPDPSPEVALLRAKLEAEQLELRAIDIGVPESFVRYDVDVVMVSEVDVGEGNKDVKCSDQEVTLGTESEAFAVQVEETARKIEKKEMGSGDDVKKSSMLAAPVVDGPLESGKIVRRLRDRNPIQVHPYALEREEYRKLIKTGRREDASDRGRMVHGQRMEYRKSKKTGRHEDDGGRGRLVHGESDFDPKNLLCE